MRRPDKRQGSKRHALVDRGLDLYETPAVATLSLLLNHELPLHIWEPCAGRGAIARILRGRGRKVTATEIADYSDRDPEVLTGIDFFQVVEAPIGVRAIVTNPPFMHADRFIRRGLELVETVIVLQRSMAIEGAGRSDLIDCHLANYYPGIERLPMIHREGWTGRKVRSSAMPFAWFVFERDHPRPGSWIGRRISWRVHDGGP